MRPQVEDSVCGVRNCDKCNAVQENLVLDELPESKCCLVEEPHFIFLDTGTILDNIHVIELDYLENLILVQNVLDEVEARSSLTYLRLVKVINKSGRKCYVFNGEHLEKGDQVISAACWYKMHTGIEAVLISDDAGTQKVAKNNNISAFSLGEYVLGTDSAIFKKRCKLDCGPKSSNKTTENDLTDVFPRHSDIELGRTDGIFVRGVFNASLENCLEAYVVTSEHTVLIQGRANMNRALDGDTVEIEILPQENWTAPINRILESVHFEDEEAVLQAHNVSLTKEEKHISGRVVMIIQRKVHKYCGSLELSSVKGDKFHFFVPLKKSIPKVRIEEKYACLFNRFWVFVVIDTWPRRSKYPHGLIHMKLGNLTSIHAGNEAIRIENDCYYYDFSCFRKFGILTNYDLENRVDLRNNLVYTVDSRSCKNLEDAFHCVKLCNGNIEVGVHIADVSHFVQVGTPLDDEIAFRGVNVYLQNMRVPMIPEQLTEICSFKRDQERFSFSCILELTPNAEIISTRFVKAVIKSTASLSYEMAQSIIDDKSNYTDIAQSLRELHSLSQILKKRRFDKGALTINYPKLFNKSSNWNIMGWISSVSKKVNVQRISFKMNHKGEVETEFRSKCGETDSMVREFMILTNVSVAQRITKAFPKVSLLKRPSLPFARDKSDLLLKAAFVQGPEFDGTSAEKTPEIEDRPTIDYSNSWKLMSKMFSSGCFPKDEYFTSGTADEADYRHYLLGTDIYTQFTSPCRRYGDITVHRLLADCIGAEPAHPKLMDENHMIKLTEHLNYRERMANCANWSSKMLIKSVYQKRPKRIGRETSKKAKRK